MRRLLSFLLCCMLLTGAVFADSRADEVRNATAVYTDGSAEVTMTVNITLEEAVEGLTFPLPRGAKDVTLNDTPVETSASRVNSSVDLVDLSYLDGVTGRQALTFTYTLPAVVRYEEEEKDEKRDLILEVPLLSGFEYPVESMSFAVTVPEGVEGIPSFYSGYFLQNIESDLSYQFEDGVILGTVTEVMKDKETLKVMMEVSEEAFPDLVIIENEENLHLFAMMGIAAAALVFWLLFLRSLPVFPRRTNMPPAGIHAGEIGSRMLMVGGDLTMMVFNWAQLGYIRIVPDKRERVWLHKQMEMGNERTPFEVSVFGQLFGRNRMVEGTGSRYARLWHQVNKTIDCREQITRGGLGARPVFRFLSMLVSTVAGASMGMSLIEEGTWQIVLAAALALLGSITAWKIQAGTMCLYRRTRKELPLCVLCCVLWLIVSVIADRPLAGLFSVVFQLLTGMLTAWGGRRTRSGWQIACQILGLRHYLTGAKRQEIKDELAKNPDYFFELVPYAMAFGVESAFAKRFGRHILPQCSYLDAGRASKRNAREWASIMRETADKLDAGAMRVNQYRKRR